MTKAGKSNHQKRVSSPKTWPIDRKKINSRFVPKMSPGPHTKGTAMPMMILLREVLGKAKSKSEVKKILSNKHVLVDGRTRKDEKFPVGHMDVVSFNGSSELYRIQITKSHKLLPHEISEKEASYKICKVIGKRNVRGGSTQVSLHDGRNILLPSNDKRISKIKGQHSLKISIPDQEILEILPLKEGARAIVMEGRHQGRVGEIMNIEKRYGARTSEVTFKDEEGDEIFRTALEYVFVLNKDISILR
ncbi:MAG: 30S ribosomal protein S4e [Candidatus Kariarchaeum pelagius]